jgi:hypothetical protein
VGGAVTLCLAGSLTGELTHSGFGLMVPMMAATVTATAIAYYIDGYSLYSARLPARLRGLLPAPVSGLDSITAARRLLRMLFL